MDSVRMWDGKDWERHCMAILRLHYGADELHEIPDRHGGDLGLEAYSSDGCAYQCYAALEPLATNDLYESQRDKLTTDLGKLQKKAAEVARLLGQVMIRRYMFMIPRHDSYKLVQHAKTKAAEVREWGLVFMADDFDIVVITDDAFPIERASLLGLPSSLLTVDLSAELDVADWRVENAELVEIVTRKITPIAMSSDLQRRYVDALMQQYLDGENALGRVRDKYPDQWQEAIYCRASKESLLVLEHGDSMEAPSQGAIIRIVDDLIADLLAAVPALRAGLAKTIAWASVADWLIRCPLDFPCGESMT